VTVIVQVLTTMPATFIPWLEIVSVVSSRTIQNVSTPMHHNFLQVGVRLNAATLILIITAIANQYLPNSNTKHIHKEIDVHHC